MIFEDNYYIGIDFSDFKYLFVGFFPGCRAVDGSRDSVRAVDASQTRISEKC